MRWVNEKPGDQSWLFSLGVKSGLLVLGVVMMWSVGWPDSPSNPGGRVLVSQALQLSTPMQRVVPPSPTLSVRGKHDLPHGRQYEKIQSNLHGVASIVLVDVNRGSRRELEALPGIGVILSDRIVAYRSSHGDFQQVEDLVAVSGIGPKRFKKLEPFVKVVTRSGAM